MTTRAGFPHSEICGSKPIRGSPQLIAAYHVLHRLSMPRHPLNALETLDRSHLQREAPEEDKTVQHSVSTVRSHRCAKITLDTRRPRDRINTLFTMSKKSPPHRTNWPRRGYRCFQERSSTPHHTPHDNAAEGGMRRPWRAGVAAARPAHKKWWAREDLNFRPHAYQARALTN